MKIIKYKIKKDSGQSIIIPAADLFYFTGFQRKKGHKIAEADMLSWLRSGRILNPIRMGNITIEEAEESHNEK